MADPVKFLGKTELKYLLTQLKTHIKTSVGDDFLSTEIPSSTSTDEYAPTSRAVYDLVEDTKMTIQYVTGPIAGVSSPNTRTLYVQRDDAGDATRTLYTYDGAAYVAVGTIDEEDYWATADLVALTQTEIDAILDEVYPSE